MSRDEITERARRYAKRDRIIKMAGTYLRKAEHWLRADGLPFDPGYWSLLDQTLETALEILEALPDDFFETTQGEGYFGLPGGPVNLSDTAAENIEKLNEVIERRRSTAKRLRKAALLEAVEGRTPAEAELYLDQARKLREEN